MSTPTEAVSHVLIKSTILASKYNVDFFYMS